MVKGAIEQAKEKAVCYLRHVVWFVH